MILTRLSALGSLHSSVDNARSSGWPTCRARWRCSAARTMPSQRRLLTCARKSRISRRCCLLIRTAPSPNSRDFTGHSCSRLWSHSIPSSTLMALRPACRDNQSWPARVSTAGFHNEGQAERAVAHTDFCNRVSSTLWSCRPGRRRLDSGFFFVSEGFGCTVI